MNENIQRIVLAVTVQLALMGAANGANQGLADNDGYAACEYKGTITKADVAPFKRNLATGCVLLHLSSSGGDVMAALEMGRAIRANQISVIIPSVGSCASSCVLLYAAGVERVPYGPIEIHRPYLPTNTASFGSTQQTYDRLSASIRAYLRSMNVSEQLYQMMLDVPPQEVRQLTLKQMGDVGMGYRDPVYQEYLDNKKAAALGMKKGAFLVMKARAKASCGDVDNIMMPGEGERITGCWSREFPGYLQDTGQAKQP